MTNKYTSRLVFTARLRPQVRMPPVRNACRTSCPIPSSKRTHIPNFWTRSVPNLWTRPMSRIFEHTFLQRAYVIPCRKWGRLLCYGHAAACWWLQRAGSACGGRVDGCHVHTCIMAIGADFKMYLLRQFCLNRVKFFLQYTGDTDAENDGPEFWNSNSVIFQNFFKFSKRRRAFPLRPIWTIMVAAKLDQTRVLVTRFRQKSVNAEG